MKHLRKIYTIIILLFCTGMFAGFAQKIQQKYFTVYLNNPEENCHIKAQVCNKKTKIRYCDTLKYYWYSAGKIIITQGASEGKILHGKFSAFYYNNNLKEQGRYKKGLQNAQWMKWDNKGILLGITNWKNGYRNGKQTVFDSTGIRVSEVSFKKGKLHGAYINYANGKVISKRHFINGVAVLPGEEKIVYRIKHNLKSFFGKIGGGLKRKSNNGSNGSDSKTEKEINSKEKQDKKKEESKPKSEKKVEKTMPLSPQTQPPNPIQPPRTVK